MPRRGASAFDLTPGWLRKKTAGLGEADDPGADREEPRASHPLALPHAAAISVSNRLCILGGYRDGWTAESELLAYDSAADRKQARQPMPIPRHGMGVAEFQGRVYVLPGGPSPGGSASAGGVSLDFPRNPRLL